MEEIFSKTNNVISYYYQQIPGLPSVYTDDRLPNLKKHRQTCDKNRKKRKQIKK